MKKDKIWDGISHKIQAQKVGEVFFINQKKLAQQESDKLGVPIEEVVLYTKFPISHSGKL